MRKMIREVFNENLQNGKRTAIILENGEIYPIVSIFSESTYHIILKTTDNISGKNVYIIQHQIKDLLTYE
ncbi:hypothetical protein MT341_08880 [Staphylococcus sp. NRL 18/288]|nr:MULTISPECIES: hypothetical protein [unclassified Staphylococcus]MCJ1656706.1 hypothetical protein [Staphylococcus sp. NRL 21/187]MCJ1662458.1 hypothetical protein [Staphylococcus sp. NRL 18/288]